MTLFALDTFKTKLESGTFYRTKSEVQAAAKSRPDKSNWFRQAGKSAADAVLNVPPTPNQELFNMIRNTLHETRQVEGTKVRAQQAFGRTMLDQIRTADIGSIKKCDRTDCLVCCDPESKGGCRQESVTYQIHCDRQPCNTRFNKSDPLAPPAPGPDPPALYRGETSRTPYLRGSQHIKDYKTKSDVSTLWRHTAAVHSGVVGEGNGVRDYAMQVLDVISKPLDRIVHEGVYIGELDELEDLGCAISLNSKKDFLQANTVTLNYTRGAKKLY